MSGDANELVPVMKLRLGVAIFCERFITNKVASIVTDTNSDITLSHKHFAERSMIPRNKRQHPTALLLSEQN